MLRPSHPLSLAVKGDGKPPLGRSSPALLGFMVCGGVVGLLTDVSA